MRGRGRPRAEPAEEQRRRIVDSFRRTLAETPYDEVTIADVARRARVSRAVVYELIGGKEELLAILTAEVAEVVIGAVERRVADAPVGGDVPSLVREEVAWALRMITADPTVASVIVASGRVGGAAGERVTAARRQIEGAIARLHRQRLAALGFERGAAADALAVMVLAAVEQASLRCVGDDWDVEATAALLGEFVAGGYERAEVSGAAHDFDRSADTRGVGRKVRGRSRRSGAGGSRRGSAAPRQSE
ncbi:MAG: hypothetical protein KatS3mg008_1916 [Acidimicrobiales bacterium]|nr:MAG: hypothetical protein KatS3mg008_1916 [Acidimicrobiales bacterium]